MSKILIDEATVKLALDALESLTRYDMVRANIFRQFHPTATGDYVNLQEFREKTKPFLTTLKALTRPAQEQGASMSKKNEALKLALRSIRELVIDESDDAPALQGVRMRKMAAEKALREALAEQPAAVHEMTNIERHERNLQKFLAEQPAQRKPLTVHEIAEFVGTREYGPEQLKWFRLGEAAHGIKENT